MLKDWERITGFYSSVASHCDTSHSLLKTAAFKKSLICHQEGKGMPLFVTWASCFCREVSIIIRLIKITFKTNVDFLHCLHKLALDLDSEAKKFNLSVLFWRRRTVILKTNSKADKTSQVTLRHSPRWDPNCLLQAVPTPEAWWAGGILSGTPLVEIGRQKLGEKRNRSRKSTKANWDNEFDFHT